jgi:hypothetical protein
VYADTTDLQRTYERSLRELRHDMGCTPERLMERPELLITLRRLVVGDDQGVPVSACIHELRRLVANLSDPKLRDPLLVALHLDAAHEGRTLTDRRKRYSQALQRSRSSLAADIRTLERRENKGIGLVARLLAEEYRPSQQFGSTPSEGPTPTLPFSKGLTVEAISHVCHFSRTGVMASQEVTRWVRAVVPNASPRIVISNRYYSESRSGVLRLESVDGCEIIDLSEGTGGGVLATIEIFQTLSPSDGTYPFTCRLLVDSDTRCEPVVQWRPPVHHTRRIEFRLSFEPEMTPLRAWWFSGALDIEGQIEPGPDESRHLDILADGRYIFKLFDGELAPGRYYGVAWAWR